MEVLGPVEWDIIFQKQPRRRVSKIRVLCSCSSSSKTCLKQMIFQRSSIKALKVHFKNYHRSYRNSYTCNRISIKHLLTATSNFWNYCRQSIGIIKKYSENLVDYFPPGKNGMTESVSTQKLFHIIVVHSKPFIKKTGICY